MKHRKHRKLTAEKQQAIERKSQSFNISHNATDVDVDGRPWWWNATLVMDSRSE